MSSIVKLGLKAGFWSGVVAAGALAIGQTEPVRLPDADSPIGPAVSQVRIVRLSQVQGVVRIDRGMNRGFEPTFSNLPVTQGARLVTEHGFAEVEFEDDSSLRLGPDSEVAFPELARAASGATINHITLVKGTMYLSLAKDKQSGERQNDVEVVVGERTFNLSPASHIRMDVFPAGSDLAVFRGKVRVADGSEVTVVAANKAMEFGGPGDATAHLVRDEAPGLYDEWDQTAVRYHEAKIARAYAASPYPYGSQDLNAYGSFSDLAGCGQVWRPYFASAAWDPFASGVWTYYNGAGYSWVSPYPWGWTPYHSGSWISCGAAGWGWQPNQSWAGLNNPVLFKKMTSLKPPTPIHSAPAMIPVGVSLLRSSRLTPDSHMVFARDSAGLGVPRASSLNLARESSHLASRGVAQAYVSEFEPVAIHSGATTLTGVHTQASGSLTSRPVASSVSAGRSGSSSVSSTSSASWSGSHSSANTAPVATNVAPGNSIGSGASAPAGGGSHH